MGNLAQLSGLASAALMIWSGAHLILADRQAHVTGAPSLAGDEKPVSSVSVAIDPIQGFDEYYINEVNPFVPYSKRQLEKKRMWERRRRPRTKKPPAQVPKEKKPTPPPEKPVELPKLELPKYAASTEDVPQILGSVTMADRFLVLVKLGDKEQQMTAGDRIGGWTLTQMRGSMVTFKDPDGEALQVNAAVGSNEVSAEQAAAQAPQTQQNTGGLLPSGYSQDQIIEMMKDPANAQQLKNALKDPKVRKMLMNPTVQRMLRENGLEHLLR